MEAGFRDVQLSLRILAFTVNLNQGRGRLFAFVPFSFMIGTLFLYEDRIYGHAGGSGEISAKAD